MSVSVSIGNWQAASPHALPAARALEPELLLEHGILGDPADPQHATRRARGLVQQGRYRDARALLLPHARVEGALGRTITELLATCAIHSGNSDAEALLSQALNAYLQADDRASAGRVHRALGELLLARGSFAAAEQHFAAAATIFARLDESTQMALVDSLRAQLLMRAGYADRALAHLDATLLHLDADRNPRIDAIARLERARVQAYRGDVVAAARDLLVAERKLGVSGSTSDRLRARIVRAEALVITGEGERAAPGLKRLLLDVVDLDEVAVSAWVHTLLGQALVEHSCGSARQHLMRGRHLYASLQHHYFVAACDIALARVEARLGLNPRGRLAKLTQGVFAEWPFLAARLQITRAEIGANEDPEAARLQLYRARMFGLESGNRTLAREAERTLFRIGVVNRDVADLTPVDTKQNTAPPQPVVEPVPMTVANTFAPALAVGENDGAPSAESPQRHNAQRLVSTEAPNRTVPDLRPPRAVGPRLR